MSIEQTKLFKESIETPILKTNTFTSENLEGNNIIADTVWFAGHDLEDTLFGDNIEEMVFDPIEIISKANTGTISYGAEQIIAFQMKVTQDYKGKYMTSVTLRRCDTNTGGGKPIAQLEQVYLYANCMNSDGEVIDRFYSFDKHQQTQDDGLQTTWHFEEPIKISKDYEFIRFYCTRVRGEAQTNVNLRSSNIKIDDTRQYINGWKTVDQASIKEFTTDFCVNVYQRTTGLLDHVNNTTIHVTAADKERWDNSSVEINAGSFIEIGENDTISVKTADELSQDDTTVPTTKTVHEAISGHVDDDSIHVTQTEKDKWNSIEIPEQIVYQSGNNVDISTDKYISVITTDVIDESDKIPTSNAVFNTLYEKRYETKQFTNFDDTKYDTHPETVGTAVLSKKHFISGCKITKVSIPHDKNIDNGEGGYLVIDVFKEKAEADGGYDKSDPYYRYQSDNYYAYKMNANNGKYEWTFNNTECIIPDDYKVVHLSIVTNSGDTPSVGSSINKKLRLNCLKINGSREQDVVYEEDDECKLYWNGSTNGANRVAIVEVEYATKTLVVSKITELNTTLENHITSDVHLSSTDKTNISKVSQLESSLNGHIGDDTHVSVTEKSQIAKVSSIQSNVESLTTKYNAVTTILNNSLPDIETFSTLDSGNYKINSNGKCNSTGVQFSREHFTTGSIKVVEICHVDGINASDIRLCAIVFNHGEDENSPKTIDDCIFSVNTQTQISGVGGSMCFRFNNLELPDDYEFVRFLFAKGDTVIPVHNDSNTVLEARVQVLARNVDGSVFDESPDDECKVMHISSTSNWYPHVRAIKTVLGYSDIVSLINRVSQLEARVSELENS